MGNNGLLSELTLPTFQPHHPCNHWVLATLAPFRCWNMPGHSCVMLFPLPITLFLPILPSSSNFVPANCYFPITSFKKLSLFAPPISEFTSITTVNCVCSSVCPPPLNHTLMERLVWHVVGI